MSTEHGEKGEAGFHYTISPDMPHMEGYYTAILLAWMQSGLVQTFPGELPDTVTFTMRGVPNTIQTRFFPMTAKDGIVFLIGSKAFALKTVPNDAKENEVLYWRKVCHFLQSRNEEDGVECPDRHFQSAEEHQAPSEAEQELYFLLLAIEKKLDERTRLDLEIGELEKRLVTTLKNITRFGQQRSGGKPNQFASPELEQLKLKLSSQQTKSHISINEIAVLTDRQPNTISTYLGEMREQDKNLPKKRQRIKTPKYKKVTWQEYQYLLAYMAQKNERPGGRSQEESR